MHHDTSSSPLVSIIMAARDTEPYIQQCLDSILNQTYQNWELIAVNDHSSDRTPEILSEHARQDSRINVFHSDGYKLIPALQYGYKRSKGELINRMDSDDYMPPDKLEILVSEWKKYGKRHIIAGGTKHFVDRGKVGGGFLRYEKWLNEVARKSTHYREIYQECVIPSHCWILHREDFDSVDAFNPEVYPEDYDLCFRFYEKGLTVIGINKILHYWRDRSERISRTWEEYKDNRYFQLKLNYFYQLDRDFDRPLVLWGAGKNGKDMAKLIGQKEKTIHWISDNSKKIGKDIYGRIIQKPKTIQTLENPQIMVVVSSPSDKTAIYRQLSNWNKQVVKDFWFFL